MKIDFDDYCEKYGPDILDNIEEDILSLNLPTIVHEKLIGIIEIYEFDILEYYYEQSQSEYEDTKYQEHKESKIF